MVRAVVADLSHHNWDKGTPLDFAAARAAGVVGVIFKASEGSTYRDPTYEKSRKLAKDAGLLWGAYHFGTAANVQAQVSNFLAAAKPDADTLLVLDFEKNEASPANTMSKAAAASMLQALETRTGRKPTIYTGPFMYDVFGKTPSPQLAPYRVWWARYNATPELHPTWASYWLWQYTDGFSGPKPRQINGLGYCDCNHFEGSDDALRAAWTG